MTKLNHKYGEAQNSSFGTEGEREREREGERKIERERDILYTMYTIVMLLGLRKHGATATRTNA